MTRNGIVRGAIRTGFLVGLLLLLFSTLPAVGGGGSCNQYLSGASGDTYTGTDQCDEFNMNGGADEAIALDNPCCTYSDSLFMGTEADIARGQGGQDYIQGGGNSSGQDVLKGGGSNDVLFDAATGDWDLHCGGDGQDYIDQRDSDNQDTAKGEGNPVGHGDNILSDSNDVEILDGTC